MRPPHRVISASHRGFSLVLSLTVMAMLLLLCLSVAAMLTVELRVARSAVARVRARLNAQAALRLAIGQLQESAGPDRRVTAPLDLLRDPEKPAPEGEPGPGDWWTGVWRTDRLLAEAGARAPDPIIHRNLTTGGLEDRRADPGYDAKTEIADLLISIPTDGPAVRVDRSTPLDKNLAVARLLGPGHLPAGAKDTDGVLVPKIPLRSRLTAAATDPLLGHLAWWTADEGVKARTDLREPAYPTAAETQTAARIAPTLMGLGTLDGLGALRRAQLPGNDVKRDRLTPENLSLLLAPSAPYTAKEQFHGLTAGSLSVLADPARGGLKRDLTPFLLSPTGSVADDATGVGLNDATPLVDYAPEAPNTKDNGRETDFYKESSPRFGILRDWARIRAAAGAGPVTPVVMRQDGGKPGSGYDDGANRSQVKLELHDKQALTPILTEMSVYLRLTYDDAAAPGATPGLRLRLHPRVQLWNPYNVTLAGKEYFVAIRMLTPWRAPWTQYRLYNGPTPFDVRLTLPTWSGVGRTALGFVLRSTELKPGECVVFTADTPAKAYDNGNQLRNNTLSATPSSPANYFYLGMPTPAGPVSATTTYALSTTSEDDFCVFFKELRAGDNPPAAPMITYTGDCPRFGDDNHQGPTFNPVPLGTWSDTLPPHAEERHGLRLRWIREHEGNRDRYTPGPNVDIAPVANYNLRSSTNLRYPWDNNPPLASPLFWCQNVIRDYPDPSVEWITPPVAGGHAVGNPFGAIGEWPGVNTFTLFDLPEKPAQVGAIAQFRHARLSEYSWHPTYAVGESLISPNVPADTTGRAPDITLWSPGMGNGSVYAVQALRYLPQNEQLVYDQSYELNTTLYDRFFLSTGDDADKEKFLTTPAKSPLPNARLILNPLSAAPPATRLAALTHHRRCAAELMVAGGFNVNSTRVDAWRALFAALRDVPLGSRPADDTKDKTAYSRLSAPAQGGADASVTEKRPEAHAGFRSLTDDDITRLAQKMVEQVRKRGPFLSVADFVNRRLRKDYARPTDPANVPPAYCGALQAAIEAAGLNAGLVRANETIIPAGSGFNGTKHLADQKALAQTYGLPGYLTQGDLLQTLDPVLTARSDTFRIRTLGESEDGATVHLEAMVQRFPDPIRPDTTGLNPDLKTGRDFGRRFRVVALRELSADEL